MACPCSRWGQEDKGTTHIWVSASVCGTRAQATGDTESPETGSPGPRPAHICQQPATPLERPRSRKNQQMGGTHSSRDPHATAHAPSRGLWAAARHPTTSMLLGMLSAPHTASESPPCLGHKSGGGSKLGQQTVAPSPQAPDTTLAQGHTVRLQRGAEALAAPSSPGPNLTCASTCLGRGQLSSLPTTGGLQSLPPTPLFRCNIKRKSERWTPGQHSTHPENLARWRSQTDRKCGLRALGGGERPAHLHGLRGQQWGEGARCAAQGLGAGRQEAARTRAF